MGFVSVAPQKHPRKWGERNFQKSYGVAMVLLPFWLVTMRDHLYK